MNQPKRKELFRDTHKGKIAGICAGIANYFGWELWLIRIAFVTGLILNSPLFIVIYIAAWLILSKDKVNYVEPGHQQKNESENYHRSTYSNSQYSTSEQVNRQSTFDHNEQIKVKARVWQAGEPPKKALKDIYGKFKTLEKRLNTMEQHVTSSNFDLSREIDKL